MLRQWLSFNPSNACVITKRHREKAVFLSHEAKQVLNIRFLSDSEKKTLSPNCLLFKVDFFLGKKAYPFIYMALVNVFQFVFQKFVLFKRVRHKGKSQANPQKQREFHVAFIATQNHCGLYGRGSLFSSTRIKAELSQGSVNAN